jgi:CHAD domain-containing protein
VIDIHRHADTALGHTSMQALSATSTSINLRFEVSVERVQRIMRSGATRVQATFDRGELRAGNARSPLCDLTLERLAGPQAGLFVLAARWVEGHGLWFNARSWLAWADELAQSPRTCEATPAGDSPLSSKLEPDAALRAVVGSCLDHLLPNAAQVAVGNAGPEHLHQTRVAMRRLRTALRVLDRWSADVDPGWSTTLDDVFGRLGATRDRDALSAGLLPKLMAAGAPIVEMPLGAEVESPMHVLRGHACNRVLLELLGFSVDASPARTPNPAAAGSPSSGHKLAKLVPPMLSHMHRQIAKDARHFLAVDDPARHRTRKRLKRLRYSVEFVAPLFSSKAVQRYLEPLRLAQDALGAFNDLSVADLAFRAQVAHDARAWFAIGWLAARREACLRECSAALDGLAHAERFWKP